MRRRDFITGIAGSAAAWPLAARAQQAGRVYRLGILSPTERDLPTILAFLDELRLHGFIEGHNLTVLPDGFNTPIDQLAGRAVALAKAEPDVLRGVGELATRALKTATETVPIVGAAEDMVASGLVSSLSRPGGNITGISQLSPELDGKRLDILIEAVPSARRMAALTDATQTPQSHTKALQDAVRHGVELLIFGIARPEQIEPTIEAAKTSGAQAVNVLASPLLSGHRNLIIERMAALRLPAIYQFPEIAEAGGFAAYGPRIIPIFRQQARTVVKILRGAKPADIPVEQPARFELVINLQAAKAIGYEVPAGLVLRADTIGVVSMCGQRFACLRAAQKRRRTEVSASIKWQPSAVGRHDLSKTGAFFGL